MRSVPGSMPSWILRLVCGEVVWGLGADDLTDATCGEFSEGARLICTPRAIGIPITTTYTPMNAAIKPRASGG
jgi:hypothetical protein